MLLTPLHALQVYGDAVLDEAPLLILTNYYVTIFLKRSEDVLDKRLWASEPIWFDQTDPSARASWLHGLQQAEELRDLKQRLPRAVVPPTLGGVHIQPSLQHVHKQQQAAEAGSAAGKQQRNAGEHADEAGSSARLVRRRVSLRLQARSPSDKGYVLDRKHSPAPPPAPVEVTYPGAEETLALSELGLTGELLGGGQHGHTLKVSLSAHTQLHPLLMLVPLACSWCS